MKVGDKAPEILGKDEQGRDIRLSDYKGRKLVLYFYPKDNTSGCTAEACSLRDRYTDLQGAGYEVVGVSKDSAASHQKFKEKHSLPFPLIADVDKTLLEDGRLGREDHVRQEDDGHHPHHLYHQRGRRHRADFLRQASQYKRTCHPDTERHEVITLNNITTTLKLQRA